MDDVFDDEVEQTVTTDEYLNNVEAEELNADLVLGGDEGVECTYNMGYMKRQAIFSCLTCTPDGNAGVCTACSLSCHDGHESMGNCINPSTRSWRNEEDGSTKELHQEKKGVEPVKESGNVEKAASIKVKLVLTKEELEWLMFQLKINGGKKLEDVLGEIERGRSIKVKTWKPSLESVMEIPQGLDENERRVV